MIIINACKKFFLSRQYVFRKKQYIISLLIFLISIGIPYTPDQEPNDIRVIGEGVRKGL